MKDSKWLWSLLALGTFTVFSVHALTDSKNSTTTNYPTKGSPKKNNSTATHRVGDCFGGGVITYINGAKTVGKQHGLIAALADIPKSFEWDTQANKQSTVKTGSSIFTGRSNTTTAISKIGAERAHAASAALHYTDGKFHDWYLPSKDELSTMYWQAITHGREKFWKNCGGTSLSGATYWSSTQSTPIKAWGLSFAGGVVVTANKTSPLLVRAVRAF